MGKILRFSHHRLSGQTSLARTPEFRSRTPLVPATARWPAGRGNSPIAHRHRVGSVSARFSRGASSPPLRFYRTPDILSIHL